MFHFIKCHHAICAKGSYFEKVKYPCESKHAENLKWGLENQDHYDRSTINLADLFFGVFPVQAFIKFLEAINEWTGRIFSWTVAVLTVIVVFEVVLRYFFNSPTICNFEITKQLYGFYFIILAGYALLHGSHVSVDILYNHLSEKSRAILDIISYLIFFFPFCVVIVIYGTYFALDSWNDVETSWSACGCPLYPIKTIVSVSFLLIAIQGVAIFIKTVVNLIKGEGNA